MPWFWSPGSTHGASPARARQRAALLAACLLLLQLAGAAHAAVHEAADEPEICQLCHHSGADLLPAAATSGPPCHGGPVTFAPGRDTPPARPERAANPARAPPQPLS